MKHDDRHTHLEYNDTFTFLHTIYKNKKENDIEFEGNLIRQSEFQLTTAAAAAI